MQETIRRMQVPPRSGTIQQEDWGHVGEELPANNELVDVPPGWQPGKPGAEAGQSPRSADIEVAHLRMP